MFDDAISHFQKYRERYNEALYNKKAMRWFASDAESLTKLIDETFGSATENAEWEELDASGDTPFSQLQAVRLKIAFLSGCRHDIRSQMAIGMDNEAKTPVDFDRHAVSDARYAQFRLELLKQAVKTKEKGPKVK